jgi:hypothetical protein
MQANKFTVKSRAVKAWAGCVEYVVLDPEQKEHGPFNTRPQANAYVAKILGIPLKEAFAQIED